LAAMNISAVMDELSTVLKITHGREAWALPAETESWSSMLP